MFGDIFFVCIILKENVFFILIDKLYFIFGVAKDFVYVEPIKKYRLRTRPLN